MCKSMDFSYTVGIRCTRWVVRSVKLTGGNGMTIYIILGIMLVLSMLVVFFALKANALLVRFFLAIISAIPWVLLMIFLSQRLTLS